MMADIHTAAEDSDLAQTHSPAQVESVALFSAYYPSHGGGMELACEELTRGLLHAGVKVNWVAQADPATDYQLEESCIPIKGTDFIYALTGVPMPIPYPGAIVSIAQAIKRSQVVIVAEANFVISVIAFVLAKLVYRRPILLVQHVGEPSTVSRIARLVMRLGEIIAVRPMVSSADALVCVSPVVAHYFADLRSPKECRIIGHGVDMACFRLPVSLQEQAQDRTAIGLSPDRKVVCFVGRLTESKGIAVIAEMARLRPDWQFAVAGIGPVDTRDWGLPNVFALGQLNRADVARLYRASDCAVLPSRSESYSLVVREALACGSRVLCSEQILKTDSGLAPYIYTQTVDLGHVRETGRRFAESLDHCAAALSHDARDYVMRECSWAAVNDEYLRMIKQLASSTSNAPQAAAR